jgi:molybdopterin molybdotransferase
VSVGEEDHIKPAVEALGTLDLWQIAMKPGKPFAWDGAARRGRWGRPGLSFHRPAGQPGVQLSSPSCVLVRPFVLRLQGAREIALKPSCHSCPRPFLAGPRPTNAANSCACGAMRQAGWICSTTRVRACSPRVWGDGVVDNPAGTTIAHGDMVSFIAFSELLA